MKIQNLSDECAYWQQAECEFGSIVDELQDRVVDKMLEVVKSDHICVYEEFVNGRAMLYKRFADVKETVNVLNIVKHFFEVGTSND